MNSNRQCDHDWAGIMVLGTQAAQECRKCEAVLLQPDAANALFGALASATTSAAMVEGLNSSEHLTHEELQRFQVIYVECSGDEDWPSGAAIETAMADLFRSRSSRTTPPHPTEVGEAVMPEWADEYDRGRFTDAVKFLAGFGFYAAANPAPAAVDWEDLYNKMAKHYADLTCAHAEALNRIETDQRLIDSLSTANSAEGKVMGSGLNLADEVPDDIVKRALRQLHGTGHPHPKNGMAWIDAEEVLRMGMALSEKPGHVLVPITPSDEMVSSYVAAVNDHLVSVVDKDWSKGRHSPSETLRLTMRTKP